MGWLIALGLILALIWLPLGVCLRYDHRGPEVLAQIGPVRWRLYPGRKKPEKKEITPSDPPKAPETPREKQENKPAAKPEKTETRAEKTQPSGGAIRDFWPFVRLARDFLGDFRGKLRVRNLELQLTLVGDDPADLAVNYGRTWAALGNLWPRLERWFHIQKRQVAVQCDFTARETKVYARVELRLTLGRALALVVPHGIRAWKEYWKQKKGGAAV